MHYEEQGRVIRGVGGLYEILLQVGDTPLSGGTVFSRAKGNFRIKGITPLVGDLVRVRYDETAVARYTADLPQESDDGGGVVIAEILPRKNALIRPPMANLGVLFITFAAAKPDPVTETIDKLIAIAEYNGIEPVPVICKQDIAPARAAELCEIYRKAGFTVFAISSLEGEGIDDLRVWISENLGDRIAAFSGASGVGKSTLLNALCPDLGLETGDISHKISRGKHTTRRVELYPVGEGYVADTPGFSMLDFEHFDFFNGNVNHISYLLKIDAIINLYSIGYESIFYHCWINTITFVVSHHIISRDKSWNITTSFPWQIIVNFPKIKLTSTGSTHGFINVARTTVISSNCQRPITIDIIKLFEVSHCVFSGNSRITTLVN